MNMGKQYRCIYCDSFIPEDKVKQHLKKTHNVSEPRIIEVFSVVVMG